ncbi:hypothetical protein B0H19DRAFT_1274073 [Mycena capillaripes]|nr:hypothetical protein B0H19DRAFT_1274073 [Mycena capillaripes]
MFAKFIPSALLFFALTQGAMAVVCGDPPLPACPSFTPCPPCMIRAVSSCGYS